MVLQSNGLGRMLNNAEDCTLRAAWDVRRSTTSQKQGSHIEGQCLHKLHLAAGDVHLWWLFPEDVSALSSPKNGLQQSLDGGFPGCPPRCSIVQDSCLGPAILLYSVASERRLVGISASLWAGQTGDNAYTICR